MSAPPLPRADAAQVPRPRGIQQQPRQTAMLAPGARLDPPTFTGSTAGAVVHALSGLGVALALLLEPSTDYLIPLWQGVADAVAPLARPFGVAPLHLWGVVMLVPSVTVLAGLGKPWTMWPLASLSVAWALFAGPALWIGWNVHGAALPGGIAFLSMSAGALRASAALGRRRTPRR